MIENGRPLIASTPPAAQTAGGHPAQKCRAPIRTSSTPSATCETRCCAPASRPRSRRCWRRRWRKQGRAHKDGVPFIAPGYKDMAVWGGCDRRTAIRNFETLQNCRMIAAEDAPRGRGYKRRFRVDHDGLRRWLHLRRVNARDELFTKLNRIIGRPIRRPSEAAHDAEAGGGKKVTLKGDEKGDKKGDIPLRNPLRNKRFFRVFL